jgi:predicted DNA-binding protein (MmcQ/YjbR family)
MDIFEFREYCLSLAATEETFPFDESTLVFKVMGKMYALTDVDLFESVNLKCDPVKALELRDRYASVGPGFHMNKKHWNTIRMDGSLPDSLIREWIRDSYDLVVAGLTKAQRRELERNRS